MTPSDFIEQIVKEGMPSTPWINSSFENDFILLSEFSELEGPKPLLTLPHIEHTKFNLNAFAVRIMSADCVSIMQATELSEFNIAGDIQVVLTELTEGAVAYVHHFVLYDICARGFVRPFCLAYITHNYCELMTIFDQVLQYFSTVALLLHFGNAMNFINDIKIRLHYLNELDGIVKQKEFDICMDNKLLTEAQKGLITHKVLHDLATQLAGLKEIYMQYISKDLFLDHQKIFSSHFKNIQKNSDICDDHEYNINEASDLKSLNLDHDEQVFLHATNQNASHIPADVIASILGKKHYKSLRSLNELCDVTYLVAFDILKFCLYNLKNKLKPLAALDHSKTTNYSLNFCGMDFTALVVVVPAKNDSKERSCCQEKETSLLLNALPIHMFLKPPDVAVDKVNTKNKMMDETSHVGSFLSFLQFTSLSSPIHSPIATNIPISIKQSSMFKETKNGFTILEDPSFLCEDKHQISEGSSGSYKDHFTVTSSSSQSLNSVSTTSTPDPVQYSCSESIVSNEDGISESAVSFLRCDKVSLLSLRKRFSFLPHIVYSLFLRRPVVIMAEERQRRHVKKLIYCLANFLPQNKKYGKKIQLWWTNVIQIKDLQTLSIIGVAKSVKTHPVPQSLRHYVTLLDYEKQTLSAPFYDGHYLNDMFETSRSFPSDQSYRQFIRQKFAELLSITYVHFATLHMQSGKFNISGVVKNPKIYSSVYRSSLSRCDKNLIKELANYFKEFVLDTGHILFDGDLPNKNLIQLNFFKCSLISNKIKRKR